MKAMAKRLLAMILTLLLCGGPALGASASWMDENGVIHTDDGWHYFLENGEAFIYRYSGTDIDLVIPGEIDGYLVTRLGNSTSLLLENDTPVRTITIPASVTKINLRAFSSDTYHVTDYYAEESSTYLASIDGVLYVKNSEQVITNILRYPAGRTDREYTVASGWKINASAFHGARNLETIHLPETITEIGDGSFFDCRNLQNINLPEGLVSIGASAFKDCKKLASLVIPNGVTKIYSATFAYCDVLNITIPDSVTSVADDAFGYYTYNGHEPVITANYFSAAGVHARKFKIRFVSLDGNPTVTSFTISAEQPDFVISGFASQSEDIFLQLLANIVWSHPQITEFEPGVNNVTWSFSGGSNLTKISDTGILTISKHDDKPITVTAQLMDRLYPMLPYKTVTFEIKNIRDLQYAMIGTDDYFSNGKKNYIYTDEAWASFTDALAKGRAIEANPSAYSQEEIDQATSAMYSAERQLQESKKNLIPETYYDLYRKQQYSVFKDAIAAYGRPIRFEAAQNRISVSNTGEIAYAFAATGSDTIDLYDAETGAFLDSVYVFIKWQWWQWILVIFLLGWLWL